MKIEWNKVTWYSKIIALALFVALPFIGFWYGTQYGELIAPLSQSQIASSTASVTGASDYYSNVAEWQTESNFPEYFSIAYPIDFDINDSINPGSEWRAGSDEASAGILFLTLTIPRAFEPQTNFAGAQLTVGESLNGDAILNCLTPDVGDGPATATSSITINGTSFTVFKSSDVAAGNIYETTSYRTLHANACYAIEYTIHSSEIGNYPASYNLMPFDEGKVTDVLNRIVGTFKFP